MTLAATLAQVGERRKRISTSTDVDRDEAMHGGETAACPEFAEGSLPDLAQSGKDAQQPITERSELPGDHRIPTTIITPPAPHWR